MASNRWFGYESNGGTIYGVQLKEGIGESTNLGFRQDVPSGTDAIAVNGTLPLRMRYVNAFRVVNDITERGVFYVGTVVAMAAIEASASLTVDGAVWSVSSTRGEARKIIPATDTEQLDGDVDQQINNA